MKNKLEENTIFGYCRCSTNEDLQDIGRQKRELLERGVPNENIFFEYESGKKENRVELKKMLAKVKSRDTIVATEVSRITRSTKQLCEIIELVKNMHLKLVLGTFVVDCRDEELEPMTEGMLKMMGVFAEMEAKMTSARVKSGMANARAKGVVIGRPKLSLESLPKKFFDYYGLFADKTVKFGKTDFAKVLNVSRPTLDKYLEVYKQEMIAKIGKGE